MASALVNQSAPNIFTMGGGPLGGPLFGLLYLISGSTFDPSLLAASRPLWHFTVGIYAWLTVTLYLVSTQLVKPVRRVQLRVRTVVLPALYLAASIAAALVIYGPFTPERVLAWWSPDPRGILPLDRLRVTRSLRRSAAGRSSASKTRNVK